MIIFFKVGVNNDIPVSMYRLTILIALYLYNLLLFWVYFMCQYDYKCYVQFLTWNNIWYTLFSLVPFSDVATTKWVPNLLPVKGIRKRMLWGNCSLMANFLAPRVLVALNLSGILKIYLVSWKFKSWQRTHLLLELLHTLHGDVYLESDVTGITAYMEKGT